MVVPVGASVLRHSEAEAEDHDPHISCRPQTPDANINNCGEQKGGGQGRLW